MSQDFNSTTDWTPADTFGISDRSTQIFIGVVVFGMCQAVNVFGLSTNIINIICFVKQGFLEPVNISLLGLAISDLGCLVTQVCINTFFIFIVGVPNDHFDAVDVVYLVGVTPHFAFVRVNMLITAIITMERCLCVMIPLQVKSIVTTKRMWILISIIYVIFLFSGSPIYAVNRLGVTFSTKTNRTRIELVSTPNKNFVESITYAVNNFFIPFVAVIIIIVCTIILVVNLQQKASWRREATQTDISSRDRKVAKMVVMISSLFIFCFVPLTVNRLAVTFEPSLNIGGKYINITKVTGSLGLLLESINSSANIFFYYYMSTKYRDTFRSIFIRSAFKHVERF